MNREIIIFIPKSINDLTVSQEMYTKFISKNYFKEAVANVSIIEINTVTRLLESAIPLKSSDYLIDKIPQYIVISLWKIPFCMNCGKSIESNIKKCSGCHLVFYCNKNCQKKNWEDHKTRCKNRDKMINNGQRLLAIRLN